MFCTECGYKVKEEWKICPKCCKPLNKNNKNKKRSLLFAEKFRSIACLIIFFICMICSISYNKIREILFVIGLVSIVTGFLKYPKDKIISVGFAIFLYLLIVYLIVTIFLSIMCNATVSDCVNSILGKL